MTTSIGSLISTGRVTGSTSVSARNGLQSLQCSNSSKSRLYLHNIDRHSDVNNPLAFNDFQSLEGLLAKDMLTSSMNKKSNLIQPKGLALVLIKRDPVIFSISRVILKGLFSVLTYLEPPLADDYVRVRWKS